LEAAELLGISTPVTLAQVKEKYRDMMKKWHPDKCHEPAHCQEMAAQIIIAYETILEYIEDFKFSFTERDVKNNLPIDRHDWWMDMYGQDPLWGSGNEKDD
jgi:hypothetical protein